MADITYKKIKGSGVSSEAAVVRTYHKLWLGPDHLLLSINKHYSEEYKRFYYKDIQAVYFRRTITGSVWNWIFGWFVSIFGFLTFLGVYQHWPIEVLSLIIFCLVCFALMFVGNVAKGTTCSTWIRTGVSKERLYSLGRVRQAIKAITLIRAEVERVQRSVVPYSGNDEDTLHQE